MNLSSFDRSVWAASMCGYIFLLTVLVVRRRTRSFPIFTSYIAENVVTGLVLYYLASRLSQRHFYYTFWSSAIFDEAFQLLVFYELAVHVFCPTGEWAPDVRKTFAGLVGTSMVVAGLLTWLAHPSARIPIQAFFLRSQFFSSALMSELFVGTMALSLTVGLPWKTHVARIAQGLGAFSLICMAKDIVSNYVGLGGGNRLFMELDRIRLFAYLACVGYWIVMLWQEAPAPRELPEAMRTKIYTLQRELEYDLIRIRAWRRS
jgi:hypothetical protein